MPELSLADLRHQCRARLQRLGLNDPVDPDVFRDALARSRGRPIELIPVSTGAGPHGLWVETHTADYVAYERDTTPAHQRHIVMHELAHIACGHRSRLSRADLVRLLLPDLHPDTVRTVLPRTVFSAEEEREAELFASLLLQHVPRASTLSVSQAAVARFEALLCGREAPA